MNWASPLVSIHELACAAIKANLKSFFVSSDFFLSSFSHFMVALVLCAHMRRHIPSSDF